MAYHADNALPSHSEGERVLPMQKGGKQRLKKSDIWVTGSFDVPFLALSLLLLTIGLVMLFSASYAYAFYNDDGNSYAYISRQLIFAVVISLPLLSYALAANCNVAPTTILLSDC